MPAQQQHITMYPEFEDTFATTNQNWNGPYWLENAIKQDHLLAASSCDDAAEGSRHPAQHCGNDVVARQPSVQAYRTIVCTAIDSIPPGRQAAKVLQCGICFSDKLFDRKYELERHMRTHEDGAFPCTVAGCERQGEKAFRRAEHLRNHLRKVHGL
ncbi:hypothetical protein M409DRAFT_22020 [Zasmidium cellare ATCC 36951]|uniref:C2H2-type domain-containing protein n=1 Tax=Zasmidium cellare ATCC 36951 TaxID=1080233 RepID=A0A6A6CPX1_ZASCE|nr:uncharacterized protein M409DRAFT_22020 [Zasmidium cellare ATCC 36951]KAF2167872.1 hypothetical protein M409DRAFT_22020 [Zasmidium cellare ATCC 36951]